MSKIIIKKNICKIIEENNLNLLGLLDRELSFKILGSEFSPSYKRGFWDGMHRILTKTLEFPYGLLPRVLELYKNFNIDVVIDDQRPVKSIGNPIDILPRLKELNKTPYFYQTETIDKCIQSDCGIIRVATGGGKTIISALLIAKLGKKSILYVIGKDLLHQTHKYFEDLFQEPIGIVGDGLCEVHNINVVSVWSCGIALGLKTKDILVDDEDNDEKAVDPSKYELIKDLLLTTSTHIIDECHMSSCSSIQEIAKHINPEYIYGMSASPVRDDGSNLLIEAVLGRNLVDISASYLIDRGFLVKPYIKFLKVPPVPGLSKAAYKTIYKDYITDNPVRNELIVKAACRLVEQNFQTLVLFNNISHGNILYDMISKKIPCILLSGKDSTEVRDAAKKKLENHEVNCVIASKIYDIGIDIPSLSGLVLAGGGKSSVRALQRIGRVIRKYKNVDGKEKKLSAIIDMYDDVKYLKDHSKIRYKIYSTEKSFDIKWIK
jgi:superfamily II DNA or RNA helicase